MDRPATRLDAAGMTPLGLLVQEAMDRRGLRSTHEVARAGGPSASTVGRLISRNEKVDRRPPGDDNLQKLARVLGVPLARLQEAAAETRGWRITDRTASDHVRTVVAAMSEADEATQRAIADVVLIIAERIHDVNVAASFDGAFANDTEPDAQAEDPIAEAEARDAEEASAAARARAKEDARLDRKLARESSAHSRPAQGTSERHKPGLR